MTKLPKSRARGSRWSAARRFQGWLASWAQDRRRGRQNPLLPAPVLRPANPSVAVWDWSLANPSRWNAYNSLDGGLTYQFDDWVAGNQRQFAPDGGQHPLFIVGVDANGVEITQRSNAVRPDDYIILDVPGLKLWVRVESLSALANNAVVGSWLDESGNAKHLAQVVVANRPTYKSNIGGKPAVYFDGANDVLATVGNVFNTDQHTIFLVAQPVSTAANDAVGTGGVGAGDVLLMVAYANNMRGHSWRGANANAISGTAYILPNVGAVFEQEVSATNLTMRINGVDDVSLVMGGVPSNLSKPVYLGSRNNSWLYNGYVRALVVFQGNPTGAQKTAIRNYLISSYGITTPYPLPPVPGAPTDLTASDNGDGSVYLTWNTVDQANVLDVHIERKVTDDPDATYTEIYSTGPLDYEYWDYDIEPAAYANGYTYRVRSYGPGGYSAYSAPATIII